MTVMSRLDYRYKLAGRSVPELYEQFQNALTRHQTLGRIKWYGNKLTAEALLNSAMMHFLDLPFDAQEKILADKVRRFERLAEEDDDRAGPSPVSKIHATPKPKRKRGETAG